MKFRSALAAATVLALPIAATAQPIGGIYIGAGAGVNIMHDEIAKFGTTGGPLVARGSRSLKTRVGPAVSVALGYGLGNGLRAEIEGSFRYNTLYGVGVGGQEQKFGGMANVLYDFVGLVPYFQPYVGLGAGYQLAQERNLHFTSGAAVGRAGTSTQGNVAAQGILGAAFPVASMPGLAFTADYRFMDLFGTRHYSGTETIGAITEPARFSLHNDFNHSILVGLRYNFGVQPPPSPAPPAAEVPPSPASRSYLVFFDWDKAVLTERARQIVAEAASNSTKVQYTKLEVNGYTDTSGTPRYNQGLSVRRAQAVAAELVKDGVPRSAIAIQGFGETHLLVPTAAGVREPQNRRVEIIIR